MTDTYDAARIAEIEETKDRETAKPVLEGRAASWNDIGYLLSLVKGQQEEIAKLQRERDLAVAHDQQPYPTTEAYEKVCAALQSREAEVARLRKLDAQSRATGCWCNEHGHPCKACEDKQEKDDRIEELERRLRIPFGKFPCAQCGGPHNFDTSVPSAVWNAVIRAKGLPEYLCTVCIIQEFVRANTGFTATFWSEEFNGVVIEIVINEQNANDATLISEENTSYRTRLHELRSEVAQLKEERESILKFFGAREKEDGTLSINMPKYHTAHLCSTHQFQQIEVKDAERCVLCLRKESAEVWNDAIEVVGNVECGSGADLVFKKEIIAHLMSRRNRND